MTRFVLLRHECPVDYREGPHWDLMLERPGVESEHRLATWSLQTLPGAWLTALGLSAPSEPTTTVPATPLPDHRARYLDYEGPLTDDRGAVRQVDGGAIAWIESGPDRYEAELPQGSLLAGRLVMTRRPGPPGWSLTVHPRLIP